LLRLVGAGWRRTFIGGWACGQCSDRNSHLSGLRHNHCRRSGPARGWKHAVGLGSDCFGTTQSGVRRCGGVHARHIHSCFRSVFELYQYRSASLRFGACLHTCCVCCLTDVHVSGVTTVSGSGTVVFAAGSTLASTVILSISNVGTCCSLCLCANEDLLLIHV
jgi:hypothetical protein